VFFSSFTPVSSTVCGSNGDAKLYAVQMSTGYAALDWANGAALLTQQRHRVRRKRGRDSSADRHHGRATITSSVITYDSQQLPSNPAPPRPCGVSCTGVACAGNSDRRLSACRHGASHALDRATFIRHGQGLRGNARIPRQQRKLSVIRRMDKPIHHKNLRTTGPSPAGSWSSIEIDGVGFFARMPAAARLNRDELVKSYALGNDYIVLDEGLLRRLTRRPSG
jgi:hypothetical protein